MTYDKKTAKSFPIRALDNEGVTFKVRRNSPEHRMLVLARLRRLTPEELEMCLLHLVEGHSQQQLAEWWGLTDRMVRIIINRAVLKVPELRPLRTKSLQKVNRPRICHLSQLRTGERGPFNADEL